MGAKKLPIFSCGVRKVQLGQVQARVGPPPNRLNPHFKNSGHCPSLGFSYPLMCTIIAAGLHPRSLGSQGVPILLVANRIFRLRCT